MPETCENWLSLVNSCVYDARQTHEIYQVLLYSVDFRAPGGTDINAIMLCSPSANSTNNFSIAIQMWWKIQFVHPNFSNPITAIFAHGTTAVLSCVPKFVAISLPGMELKWNKFSIKFELWCIMHQWNRFLVLVGAIITHLTHCGLVTPYGGRDLGQHWFG